MRRGARVCLQSVIGSLVLLAGAAADEGKPEPEAGPKAPEFTTAIVSVEVQKHKVYARYLPAPGYASRMSLRGALLVPEGATPVAVGAPAIETATDESGRDLVPEAGAGRAAPLIPVLGRVQEAEGGRRFVEFAIELKAPVAGARRIETLKGTVEVHYAARTARRRRPLADLKKDDVAREADGAVRVIVKDVQPTRVVLAIEGGLARVGGVALLRADGRRHEDVVITAFATSDNHAEVTLACVGTAPSSPLSLDYEVYEEVGKTRVPFAAEDLELP